MAADSGMALRCFPVASGPARLHFAFGASEAGKLMSIEVTYRRLREAEFERILHEPNERAAFTQLLPGFDLGELNPEALRALFQNPEALRAKRAAMLTAFENRSNDPTRVDLQQDWHALHFLLTGEKSMEVCHRENDPLHNVVMGGHETSLNSTYGPARSFTTGEVRDMAKELAKISVGELRSRFSADAFNAAEIYPDPRPGGWDDAEVESVFQRFPKLVRFFREAATADEIVIVYAH